MCQILNDLHQMVLRDAVSVGDSLDGGELITMKFQVKEHTKRVVGMDRQLHEKGISSGYLRITAKISHWEAQRGPIR